MPKKPIDIDPDLREAAKEYIEKQFEVMRKHGSLRMIDSVELDDLVYRVAAYPQQLRNMDAKSRKKRRLPHSCGFVGEDGSSLLCNFCNNFEYVETNRSTETVTCPKCKHNHLWAPRRVLCAAPTHNDNKGCGNPRCFKFAGASE